MLLSDDNVDRFTRTPRLYVLLRDLLQQPRRRCCDPGHVRRANKIESACFLTQQDGVGWTCRLFQEDIDSSSSDSLLLQRLHKSDLVNNATTRNIDHYGTFLHGLELRC